MRLEEILLLIAENPLLYVLSLFINGIFVLYVTKKYVRNYLDPLFLALIGVLFANSMLIFLVFVNDQRWNVVLPFIIIEVFFWLGFFCNKYRIPDLTVNNKAREGGDSLFSIAFFLVAAFQIYYYYKQGFPIFRESRIDKYAGAASGLGILERLSFILQMYCSIYSIIHIRDSHSFKSRLFLVYLLIVSVLSGSKSALMSIITPAFFYIQYFTKYQIRKKTYFLIGISVLSAAVFVVFMTSNDAISGVLTVVRRFMMFGDTYYEALGNNVISEVKISHPINDLLVNILAPFRLMSYSANVDIAPSLQVHRSVYPEIGDLLQGPNNRLPFLFYCLFGPLVASILSFFAGKFTSWCMYKSYKYINKSLVGFSIYAMLYVIVLEFPTDPILCLSNLTSWFIGSCFIIFLHSLFVKKKA